MMREREKAVVLQSGALAIFVHGVLLALLLMSFHWKTKPVMNVAEVELWDSIPTQPPVVEPTPPVEDAPTPPVEKPEPVKVAQEPIAKPVVEEKVDIQLKKKKEIKPKEEPPQKKIEPKPDLAKQQAEDKAKLEKERQDKLKAIQKAMLDEDSKFKPSLPKSDAASDAQKAAASAVSKAESDKYISSIVAKIRPLVNKQLCGSGKPLLVFKVSMMLTGEIIGSPSLVTSSGIQACDDAVSRAILQASPLPKPPAEMLNDVRDLKLNFRPNDE